MMGSYETEKRTLTHMHSSGSRITAKRSSEVSSNIKTVFFSLRFLTLVSCSLWPSRDAQLKTGQHAADDGSQVH